MIRIKYILAVAFISLFVNIYAQEESSIVIDGTIEIDSEDPNAELEQYSNVVVYTFMGRSALNEALSELRKNSETEVGFYFGKAKPKTDINNLGEFNIDLPRKEGYMLVWHSDTSRCKYRIFEQRAVASGMKIKLNYSVGMQRIGEEGKDSMHYSIDNVEIEASRINRKTVVTRTTEEGGVMVSETQLSFPIRVKKNMRIVAQPVWYDRIDIMEEDKDTVFSYGKVLYHDCNEYSITQNRHMDYDMMHDTLFRISNSTEKYTSLEGGNVKTSNITISPNRDTVFVYLLDTLTGYDPDGSHAYPFGAIVAVGDYNTILEKRVNKDDGQRRSPLKFLDFKFRQYLPDKNKFKEVMSERNFNAPGELSLNFEQGKATIVPNDSASRAQLDALNRRFNEISSDGKSSLVGVTVYGMASPEGNLTLNKNLARSRAQYAIDKIKQFTNRGVQMFEPQVAGWDAVANLLRADGHNEYADEIMSIVTAHPGDLASQGSNIARLDYYTLLEENYLPRLRTVRYNYRVNMRAQLPADTVLERYRRGQHDGFARGEYWTLFNHIKDSRELEGVVEHALAVTRNDYDSDSVYCKGYWPYAACLLACCYIENDKVDLDILKPFLYLELSGDSVQRLRHVRKSMDQTHIVEYINFPEIAANQLIMTLKSPASGYRKHIPVLETIIQGQGMQYDTLAAVSKCLRGGYKPGTVADEQEAERIRDIVSSTSVTNAVVVNLAMDNPEDSDTKFLDIAAFKAQNLPDNAVSDYLMSVIKFRKGDYATADSLLAQSFLKDIKMVAIANNDKDLISNDGRYKVVAGAIRQWKQTMRENNDQQRNVAFSHYINALDELGKGEYADMEAARKQLYSSFDSDKRYIKLLEVSIKHDKDISGNARLSQRLKQLRNEYNR